MRDKKLDSKISNLTTQNPFLCFQKATIFNSVTHSASVDLLVQHMFYALQRIARSPLCKKKKRIKKLGASLSAANVPDLLNMF
jgi:hypothetical protein